MADLLAVVPLDALQSALADATKIAASAVDALASALTGAASERHDLARRLLGVRLARHESG